MLAVAAVAAVETINAAPYVGVITSLVMWFGMAVVIGMFAKYIVRGVAMAVTETLLTSGDSAERIARWFTSSNEVLICMKHLIEKLGDDPDKIIKDSK